jgi:small-conductance mechanosensitive channel
MRNYLDRIYFENSVLEYLIALGIILLGSVAVMVLRRSLLRLLRAWSHRTLNKYDDLVVSSIDRFGMPALHFFIFYVGVSTLKLPPRGEKILHIAVAFAITYFAIRLISSIIHLMIRSHVLRQERGEEKARQLGGLMLILNLVLWTIGLLFLFDNMGYDVTAVVTGLGIGGIAVALAAQNILGDLFNYFVIFFDRPFEIGDFLVIDQKAGTVEHIGIKTTRLKSLSGEQLVFANSDLTAARIHNYKRMDRRRAVFKFGVTYQTPYEKLKEIPGIVRSVVEQQAEVTFDRAHFLSYTDSSLEFEVVYMVLSADFNRYADLQQAINLGIFKEFEAHGIEFAYPTRTIHLQTPDPGTDRPSPSTEGHR